MHPILRNILAVLTGFVIGGIVNMGIIMSYPFVFPLPFDCPMDDNWYSCFSSNAHLLEFSHMFSVFLAHGLGTLVGAFIAAKIGVSKHLYLALVIGLLFFMGGFQMCINLNWQPMKFSVIDLILAYFPMAWIGWRFARYKSE